MKNEEESEGFVSRSRSLSDEVERPSLETVIAVAADASKGSSCETIPEDFAREWYSLMEQSGWRDTKGQRILPHGWRGKLAFAWRDEKRRRAGGGKTKGGRNELYVEHGLAESVGV